MEREPAETITGLMMKHFDALLRHSAQCFFQSSALLKSGLDRLVPKNLRQVGFRAEVGMRLNGPFLSRFSHHEKIQHFLSNSLFCGGPAI